jgi:hypothetical protein
MSRDFVIISLVCMDSCGEKGFIGTRRDDLATAWQCGMAFMELMVCSRPAMESVIKWVGGQVSPTLSSKDCYDYGHVH